MPSMRVEFTSHALQAMRERRISDAWVRRALKAPDHREPDPWDNEVERFYRRIPEFGDRVLRVAVNTRVEPWRVVSVFFDRRMKERL